MLQDVLADPEMKEGVMVAGGREGLVGVGGLLLGGGASIHLYNTSPGSHRLDTIN